MAILKYKSPNTGQYETVKTLVRVPQEIVESIPDEISEAEINEITNSLGNSDNSIAELIRKLNRKLELIETIVFDGSTVAVYRNQTPSGKAYDFDEFMLVGKGDDIAHTAVIQINGTRLYDTTNRTVVGFTSGSIAQAKYVRIAYNCINGVFYSAARAYTSEYANIGATDNFVLADSITSIQYNANGCTPSAGATLEIWGRWR